MKKLSLKLDDIRVTGFEVDSPGAKAAGTVHGAELITRLTYCDPGDTCFDSCVLDTQCSVC